MDLYRIVSMSGGGEVRQSIIRKTNWTETGFKVVGDAENGEDALEKVEASEPDLILTDTRMPYMDGLTLAERVRQEYPSVKIVIFLRYDGFEYAKQAIKLSVTEYVFKPVNVEELTAILKWIKADLNEEVEQKKSVNLLRENCIKSLLILREQFLDELVSYPMPKTEAEDKLGEYTIPLSGAKKQVAATIDIEPEEIRDDVLLPLHKEKGLVPISVMRLVEGKLKNYCRCALTTSACTTGSEITVIAAINEGNSQTGLIDVLGDVCKGTREILEVPITIGIGHGCQKLSDISSSHKAAVDALGYKTITGSGNTIYINDVEPMSSGKLQFDGKDETELASAIKFGPREKIEAAVRTIIGRMSDAKVHFRQCQVYMLSMSSSIVRMTQQCGLDMEQLLEEGSEREDTFAIMPRTQKREDFSQWLLSASLRMSQVMSRGRDNAVKQVIQKAKQYIMDNYQDPELPVEKICHHLHTSLACFSTVFKKETGQAYIAYLTEVRLGGIVGLLGKTDNKTYIIAAKVDYQEQGYFSCVFKKRFGTSPTKFGGTK